jgi:hypothetical protein
MNTAKNHNASKADLAHSAAVLRVVLGRMP